MRQFLLFSFLIVLSGCAATPEEEEKANLVLKEVSFSNLPGWGSDNLQTFVPAFKKSCDRILKGSPSKSLGPLKESGSFADWQPVCRSFEGVKSQNLKAFFENRFTPYEVSNNGDAQGLFTGYYEASLKGSRKRYGPYQTPLYQRADDLVMVQLGEFRDDLKGRRIAGRVVDGKLKPYETREEIVSGNWPHNDKVLLWVDDPVDAFFVQIQGSGVVELDNGTAMRIGYAGQNGHVYYAIGRELIKRGDVAKEDMSLQAIRDWLEANPNEAEALMNTNKSYVFFRELETDGPVGGEGVSLTAGRSLAIDRSLLSYGMPIWTDIELSHACRPHKKNMYPDESQDPEAAASQIKFGMQARKNCKLQRLMVAQDTGGAIRGPVRGDVFWGYGDKAEQLAGPMKSDGRYWVLLPN